MQGHPKRNSFGTQQQREYHRSRLQEATLAWLLGTEWNAMVTFTFNGERGVSYWTASKIFGQFLTRLKHVALGRKSRRRIPMAPIVEDSKEQLRQCGLTMDGREGTHVHCLFQFPDDLGAYKEVMPDIWRGTAKVCGDPKVYCPNSTEWFLPLDNATRDIYTGYVLKYCRVDTLGLLYQYLHLEKAS